MNCPNCVGYMYLVKLKSHYRIPLVVDQCQKCRGIWFDRHEYYRATKDNVNTLEKADLTKLRNNVVIKNKLLCPRDGKPLVRFSDPNFPKNLDVERCDQCGGFFFNQGELAQYHIWKEEKKKNILSQQYQQVMGKKFVSEREKIFPMMDKVGDFLTTPYYADHSNEQKRYVEIVVVIIQIFNVLLNFFIRKKIPGINFRNIISEGY